MSRARSWPLSPLPSGWRSAAAARTRRPASGRPAARRRANTSTASTTQGTAHRPASAPAGVEADSHRRPRSTAIKSVLASGGPRFACRRYATLSYVKQHSAAAPAASVDRPGQRRRIGRGDEDRDLRRQATAKAIARGRALGRRDDQGQARPRRHLEGRLAALQRPGRALAVQQLRTCTRRFARAAGRRSRPARAAARSRAPAARRRPGRPRRARSPSALVGVRVGVVVQAVVLVVAAAGIRRSSSSPQVVDAARLVLHRRDRRRRAAHECERLAASTPTPVDDRAARGVMSTTSESPPVESRAHRCESSSRPSSRNSRVGFSRAAAPSPSSPQS